MPSVSVIIAAYNAEKSIFETISSVLNQSFQNLEVVVIDDGSSDRTCEIVSEIPDSRVKLFPYENGGVAKARNRGIENARGKYISFLDHDDLWTADKIEAQVSALEKAPDAGVAYSWTINMYSQEDPIRYKKLAPVNFDGNVYPQLLLYNFIGSGSNILANKEAIASVGGFDPTPISNEDWDYYIRLAAKWSFVLVPEYQIIYRHTNDSMSSQINRLEQGGLIAIDKAYKAAPEKLQYLKNKSLCNHYIYCSELYIESYSNSQTANHKKSLAEAYRTLKMAISCCPKSLIKKSGLMQIFKLLSASVLNPESLQRLKKVKYQYLVSTVDDPRVSSK